MDDQQQKNRKKKSIIAAIFAILLVGSLVALVGLFAAGFALFSGNGDGSSEAVYYDEQFNQLNKLDIDRSDQLVGLLRFSGEIGHISGSSNPFSTSGDVITPDNVRSRLNSLTKGEPNLKAIILEIDSPGGEVSAADEINDLVGRLAEKYPVYVYSSQVLASGAYEMAVPAKKIYTSREALSGSIGVIGQFLNVEGLANQYGVKMETFKAGKFKDTGNPFRSPTEEEKSAIQDMINQSYNSFIANVAAGRGLDEDQVRDLATGDIWRGPQALDRGLIDGVLYKSDLVGQIKKDESLNGDLRIVEYRQPAPGFIDSLLGLSANFGQNNPVSKLGQDLLQKRSGLYYLYQGF